MPAYKPPDGVSKEEALVPFVSNMRIAAEEMAEIGVPVIIEALNPEIRPNSLLTTTAEELGLSGFTVCDWGLREGAMLDALA